MEKTLGTFGIVNAIVGFVIGASIFIIPGELAGIAGPGVIFAYLIAGFLGFLVCLTTAQLGTAVPVEGGGFVIISRLLSPMLGFLTFWLTISAVALGTALLAFGFADYFAVFFPDQDRTIIAISIIALFGIINIIGAKIVHRLQAMMVFWFLAALLFFVIQTAPHIDPSNLTPILPNGASSVLHAATIAYFSFAGFAFLLEIGGNIRNPRKSIPRGLGIGFLLVLISYITISGSLVGSVHWQNFVDQQAPVAYVASLFLPDWATTFLVSAALAAAATSINGIILAYPRDLLAMGEIGILPKAFSKVSVKTDEPYFAITIFTLIACFVASFSASLVSYAVLTVLAIMIQQIMMGIALIRLPKELPNEYENSGFKIGQKSILVLGSSLIIVSAIFIIILVGESSDIAQTFMGIILAGLAYYILRVSYLRVKGIRLDKNLKDLILERSGSN